MMSEEKRRIIQIVILMATIFFVIFSIIQERSQNERNVINALEKYASDMNGECPIAVGTKGGLVIRKVQYINIKTVAYEYKFLDYRLDDFDLVKLKTNLSKSIIEDLELMKPLEKLRNKNIIFEYHFFDNLDEEMFRLKLVFNTPITVIDKQI